MKAVKILGFIFLLSSSILFGQHSIAFRLGVNRFDLQAGIEYSYGIKQIQLHSAFDIGVNRTIFQQRFFPKLSVGTSYDFIPHEKWSLGPQIFSNAFLLNYNKELNNLSYWWDILGGIRFSYGQKWKVLAQGGLGPALVWDFLSNENRYYSTFFVNYEYSLGCAYTF